MSDDVKEQNSTPPEELRRQIMSYSEPKNEREWWAMHRIEQLEAALRVICDGPRDANKSYPELLAEVRCEARAALEGKDEDSRKA